MSIRTNKGNKAVLIVILTIAVVASMFIGTGAVAVFEHEMRGHMQLESGRVEIELSAPADPDNPETTGILGTDVSDTVPRRYTVSPATSSVPCYVRVKASIFAKDGQLEKPMTDMSSTDGRWVAKDDGYVYFTGILAPEGYNESATDFSDKPENVLIVPRVSYDGIFSFAECTPVEEWRDIFDESTLSARFSESVIADAIQAEHFSPDFESDDPWFGKKPEASASIGD